MCACVCACLSERGGGDQAKIEREKKEGKREVTYREKGCGGGSGGGDGGGWGVSVGGEECIYAG